MALSQRERSILIVVAASAAIFLGDRYALTPYMEKRDQLRADEATVAADQVKAHKLMTASRQAEVSWKDWLATGLKSDQSQADQQMVNAISRWAQEARLNLSGIKPESASSDNKQFKRIVYHANGSGPLMNISRFLYYLQTSRIPVRITDITLAKPKENNEDIQMTVGISTVFVNSTDAANAGQQQPPHPPTPANTAAAAAAPPPSTPAPETAHPTTSKPSSKESQ